MGQIMMTGFGYAQRGFAGCDGGILAVNQNQALYSLLGNVYGGNGSTTFKLPDLRGRMAVGAFPSADAAWQPQPYSLGAIGGVERVVLTPDQNAQHTHTVTATTVPGSTSYLDGDQLLAQTDSTATIYGPPTELVPLGGGPTSAVGSSAPHDNMQPFVTIGYVIALAGVYPSRD